jgi:gas vesicle protein
MNERSSYLSPALWFLAGGVVGASVSLLLAPQSGKDTRRMMGNKLNDGADSVRGFRDRVLARGEEAWDEAAHRVGEAVAAVAGTIDRKTGKKGDIPSA